MHEKPINDCPVPKGILFVIGGKENKGELPEKEFQKENSERLEILKLFVSHTRKKNPNVSIITSASEEGREIFLDYQKAFAEIDVQNLEHVHHNIREECLKDDLNDRITKADALFFTGGDQLKLTTIYGGTQFLLNLKQRYIKEPIIIGGTSAGAMAMSTPMIYAGNKDVQQISGEIKITTGLEFLKDVCIDTHFVNRSRFVRMAQAIATNPTCVGLGIEEDTAVIVKNGVEAEVCGSGVVIMIEGNEITQSNILDFNKKDAISIRNLKVHLMSNGDSFVIPQRNPPHI
ncbi:MAG: cyanophycinase [Sphingobacteriaceae bacterium]